ncbi:hypothetical protein MBANPS3_005788 [Mucor bainieri]
MEQYVLAQWDYTAEGNFELSFKEGDKIKLLEKHNDDWWEGELNDEIGFFPANRTKVYSSEDQQVIDLVKKASISSTTTSSSTASRTIAAQSNSVEYSNSNNNNAPTSAERPHLLAVGSNNSISHSNPYHHSTSAKIGNDRETVSAPTIPRVANENILVDISTENDDADGLAQWSHSQDEQGTAFFFKEPSSSDKKPQRDPQQDPSPQPIVPSAPPLPITPPSLLKKLEDMDINERVYDIQKLNLEALHPNWIRIQSSMQIKVASSTTGETQLPWKDYYGVLTNGFLLVYKEGLHKLGRRPSSMKPVPAYFTVDLRPSEIIPATKTDTRKKHAFIISLASHRLFVHIQTESLYAEWLDAMMREMIRVKEHTEQQDVDLVQLLASIPLEHKLASHASTASTDDAAAADDAKAGSGKSLTRWFSRSSRNSVHRSQTLPAPSHSASTTGTDVFSIDGYSRAHDFHLAASAAAAAAAAPSHDVVFGGALSLEQDGQIPQVVRLCIEQVEQRGLDVVGIYRLSGQTTSIQKYKALFNSSKPDQAIHLDEEHDINVITGLLKLYFRELKNPLLTFEYYDRFIEAARLQDYDERMFRLKSIIQVLPVVNYKVLFYVARHLERVKNHSHINKMEASNLALIFSMGLLRPKHDDVSASIMHNDLSSTIVETIITHVDWFFDTDTTATSTDDDASSVLMQNNSSTLV